MRACVPRKDLARPVSRAGELSQKVIDDNRGYLELLNLVVAQDPQLHALAGAMIFFSGLAVQFLSF